MLIICFYVLAGEEITIDEFFLLQSYKFYLNINAYIIIIAKIKILIKATLKVINNYCMNYLDYLKCHKDEKCW